MEHFLFIFEMIGTVAFAASGAILGIRKGMDIFGVCILGLTAACGGGMVRDGPASSSWRAVLGPVLSASIAAS